MEERRDASPLAAAAAYVVDAAAAAAAATALVANAAAAPAAAAWPSEGEELDELGFAPVPRHLLADVEPVPLSALEAADAPVSIAHTPAFSATMGLFRALQLRDERSRRALGLAYEAIVLNAANYTAWHHRRLCLRALAGLGDKGTEAVPSSSHGAGSAERLRLLLRELAFTARIVFELGHSKNYQVFQHRRVVVGWLRDFCRGDSVVEGGYDPALEKGFTARVLADDAKNYHAWSHRQWTVSAFGLWEGEADFSALLLGLDSEGCGRGGTSGFDASGGGADGVFDDSDEGEGAADVRNNSAWSHRFFSCILRHCPRLSISGVALPPPALRGPEGRLLLEREAAFAMGALRIVARNESAWSYLRGLVRVSGAGSAGWPQVRAAAAAMREAAAPFPNVFANEWLAEALEEEAVAVATEAVSGDGDVAAAAKAAFLDGARRLYAENAEAEPVRAKYWAARGRALA